MKRALSVAVLALSAACGPTSLDVGTECFTRDDCHPAQSCITAAPGGFCSHGCSVEGSLTECAAGTICTFFGRSAMVCSLPCATSDECRVNYECADVQGAPGQKACRPAGVAR